MKNHRLNALKSSVFETLDWPLFTIVASICFVGLMTLFSASEGIDGPFSDQIRNMVIALIIMWLTAQLNPATLLRITPILYLIGITLLLAVLTVGETSKGATRWLNLGITRIQPSEMLKVAVPMMLAWYFQSRQDALRFIDFIIAGLLLLIPFALIALQPDLGTAILVFCAGFFVIFLGGLSFKLIVPIAIVGTLLLSTLIIVEEKICQPGVDWVVLHDYQKGRVCTLLDPNSDPLGKGFHTIQSTIAVGSGGVTGKGYMQGTQTHLEFIPERTTDFIFAVFSEEFGLIGAIILLILYLCLIGRGLVISSHAHNTYNQLLAGALTLNFFIYVFVNIGMVTGILPVVGVPLPFISYGGTSLLTLGVSIGILMSIHKSRLKN